MNNRDNRPICPKCGNPLELSITVMARWSKKIKKDGTLYKTTNYNTGSPTDIMYLSCSKYGCGFNYNVSSTPQIQYPLLEEWVEEHYEEIRF